MGKFFSRKTSVEENSATLYERIRSELAKANTEEETKRAIFVAPYSNHDAGVAFHEARGYQRGLARALECFEAEKPGNFPLGLPKPKPKMRPWWRRRAPLVIPEK